MFLNSFTPPPTPQTHRRRAWGQYRCSPSGHNQTAPLTKEQHRNPFPGITVSLYSECQWTKTQESCMEPTTSHWPSRSNGFKTATLAEDKKNGHTLSCAHPQGKGRGGPWAGFLHKRQGKRKDGKKTTTIRDLHTKYLPPVASPPPKVNTDL